MKIIVNTKVFRMALEKAFEIECHCMKYSDGCIDFQTIKYNQSFELPVEKQYRHVNEVIKFNPLKMARLMDFLKMLPEQPIVIEIDDDDIRLEQFVMKF